MGRPVLVCAPERAAALGIVHVISSLEGEAAGPAYSVPRLCRALGELGHDVALMSLISTGRVQSCRKPGYLDRRFPIKLGELPGARSLGLSPALKRALIEAAESADILHTHGLWRYANVYPAHAARQRHKSFVLSPRGMLAPSALQFSDRSKRLFWMLSQRRAAQAVDLFHATSEQEYADIRAYGLTQPVAIIPNGIDMPDLSEAPAPSGSQKTVLFLGRLHPVKAIDRLIKAWHLLGEQSSGWRLLIVGPAERGHDEELARLVAELGLANVEIRGAAHGDEKWRLMQVADLSVLPSLSENFGVAAAESLAAGTPVIASRGTPWQGLEEHGCGWWVDNAPEDLARALAAAMSLSSTERTAMGEQGRAWMDRDFSWAGIATEIADCYRWLVNGGAAPGCVRVG